MENDKEGKKRVTRICINKSISIILLRVTRFRTNLWIPFAARQFRKLIKYIVESIVCHHNQHNIICRIVDWRQQKKSNREKRQKFHRFYCEKLWLFVFSFNNSIGCRHDVLCMANIICSSVVDACSRAPRWWWLMVHRSTISLQKLIKRNYYY